MIYQRVRGRIGGRVMSGLNGQHSGRAGMLSGVAAAIAGMTVNWASSPGNGTPPGISNTRSGTNATYYNSSGVLTASAANLLRETYQWNGSAWVYRGTIVEPAATNLVTDVRDMTTVNWTKGATVTVAQTGTGADGSANSCTRVTGGAVAATNRVSQTLVAAASQRVYGPLIKRVTGTGPILITQDGFTSTTDVSSQINSTTFTQVKITGNTLNAAYGVQVSTNGDVVLVDGNQFETGTAPTSTILTGASRSADAPVIAVPGPIGSAQGFAAMSFEPITAPVGFVGAFSNFTAGGSEIIFPQVGGNMFLYDSGVNRDFAIASGLAVGTTSTLATTWGGATCNGSVDGTIGTAQAFSGNLGLTGNAQIGDRTGGGIPFGLYLKTLRLGTQKVTNGRLAKPFA